MARKKSIKPYTKPRFKGLDYLPPKGVWDDPIKASFPNTYVHAWERDSRPKGMVAMRHHVAAPIGRVLDETRQALADEVRNLPWEHADGEHVATMLAYHDSEAVMTMIALALAAGEDPAEALEKSEVPTTDAEREYIGFILYRIAQQVTTVLERPKAAAYTAFTSDAAADKALDRARRMLRAYERATSRYNEATQDAQAAAKAAHSYLKEVLEPARNRGRVARSRLRSKMKQTEEARKTAEHKARREGDEETVRRGREKRQEFLRKEKDVTRKLEEGSALTKPPYPPLETPQESPLETPQESQAPPEDQRQGASRSLRDETSSALEAARERQRERLARWDDC